MEREIEELIGWKPFRFGGWVVYEPDGGERRVPRAEVDDLAAWLTERGWFGSITLDGYVSIVHKTTRRVINFPGAGARHALVAAVRKVVLLSHVLGIEDRP